MKLLFFSFAVAITVWIFWQNIQTWAQFEDFCVRLATMRGELIDLDTGYSDDELGMYRSKVRRALLNPSGDELFPEEIKVEAACLGDSMVYAQRLGIAWLVAAGLLVFFAFP